MSIRDLKQKEFIEKFSGKMLYNIAPRFGKTLVGVRILEKNKPKRVLISYPDQPILDSWLDEFKKQQISTGNIVFTTHLSLHKNVGVYDLIIIDEIHRLSPRQREVFNNLLELNGEILGMTGTLTEEDENYFGSVGLPTTVTYTVDDSVNDNITADYSITIYLVPLDGDKKIYKGNTRSEKKQFDAMSWVINKKQEDDDWKGLKELRMSRMRVLYNSIAKINTCKYLLQKHSNDRILVFAKQANVSDSLGIPSYHSKTKDKTILDKYKSGEIKSIAMVNKGGTGVTYKNLDRVIIESFSSNPEELTQKLTRCTNLDFNSKTAYIDIISSNETVELKWLEKSLEFLDKSKIKYVSLKPNK